MKTTNVVLYGVRDGARQPLISLDADAASNRQLAAAKITAAVTQELMRCEREGRPHSDFVVVSETRENAPDSKELKSASFTPLDFSLAPAGESVGELDQLFAAKKGVI